MLVEIDRRKVEEARKRIPSLQNQREFDTELVDGRRSVSKGKSDVREEKSAAATSAL